MCPDQRQVWCPWTSTVDWRIFFKVSISLQAMISLPFFKIRSSCLQIDLQNIKDQYQRDHGKSLNAAVSSETSGDYKKLLLAIVGQWSTAVIHRSTAIIYTDRPLLYTDRPLLRTPIGHYYTCIRLTFLSCNTCLVILVFTFRLLSTLSCSLIVSKCLFWNAFIGYFSAYHNIVVYKKKCVFKYSFR